MAIVFVNDKMREEFISKRILASFASFYNTGNHRLSFMICVNNPAISDDDIHFRNEHEAILVEQIQNGMQVLPDGSGVIFDLSSFTGKYNSDETGPATHFRIAVKNWDTAGYGYVNRSCGVVQGTIGLLGSGADIEARDVNIVSGQEYRLPESVTMTFPNQFNV